MAFEDEKYAIYKHLSNLYQEMVYAPDLSEAQKETNQQIGDDFAEFFMESLSLEVVGSDADGVLIRVKPLEDTSDFVEDFVSKPLVEGEFD